MKESDGDGDGRGKGKRGLSDGSVEMVGTGLGWAGACSESEQTVVVIQARMSLLYVL